MGSVAPLTLLGICIACFVIGLAGIVAGCYGDSWFTQTNINDGLWRICREVFGVTTCTVRKDVFHFDNSSDGDEAAYNKDIILCLLLASGILCFLGMLPLLSMFCWRKKKLTWKCVAGLVFCLGLSGASVGFAGLGYGEYEFKAVWQNTEHGWSALLAWVGVTALALGAFISAALICIVPRYKDKESNHSVHYVGNANPTYKGDNYY